MKSTIIVYDIQIDYWDENRVYGCIPGDPSTLITSHTEPCIYNPSGYKVVYTYHFGLKGSVVDHRTSI